MELLLIIKFSVDKQKGFIYTINRIIKEMFVWEQATYQQFNKLKMCPI